MSITNRLAALREKMRDHHIDALLVSQPENMRYLSGFTGGEGGCLISHDRAYLLTDARYTEQAADEAPAFTVIDDERHFADAALSLLDKLSVERLGFEQDFLTYGQVSLYRTTWESDTRAVDLVPLSGVVESLRLVKDAFEIDRIERAARMVDDAFLKILQEIRPGRTERELAWQLENYVRQNGAEGMSFETIVASGPRSALPHGRPTDRMIQTGDFITFDFGAICEGYVSDLTRTVCVGQPSDAQTAIYNAVLEAERRAIDGLQAGLTGGAVDALARDYLTERGYGEQFKHSLGHGIGLFIHESPTLRKNNQDVLQSGMVVTIEPGVYVSGLGGVRIEDDVLIEDSGVRVLTHAPKDELICL